MKAFILYDVIEGHGETPTERFLIDVYLSEEKCKTECERLRAIFVGAPADIARHFIIEERELIE